MNWARRYRSDSETLQWGAAFASIPESMTQVAIDQNTKAFGKRLQSIFENVFGLRVIPTAALVQWNSGAMPTRTPTGRSFRSRGAPGSVCSTTPAPASLRASWARQQPPTRRRSTTRRGFFERWARMQQRRLAWRDKYENRPHRGSTCPWSGRSFMIEASDSRFVTGFYELLKGDDRTLAPVLPPELDAFIANTAVRLLSMPPRCREMAELRRTAT